jgi:hypothetical protein
LITANANYLSYPERDGFRTLIITILLNWFSYIYFNFIVNNMIRLKNIISGTQTGVDLAAINAGSEFGLLIGGWCPPGRLNDNGIIPPEFPLIETEKDRSDKSSEIPRSQRTEFNVRDSDATLIFMPKNLSDDIGTEFTIKMAVEFKKPFLITDSYQSSAKKNICD